MDEATKRYLRRLALAGRWDDVRSCLRQLMEETPADAEATAEWERLERGKPMLLTLSATERREYAARDAKSALQWLMDDHPIADLRLLGKEELNELLSKFEQHERTMQQARYTLSEDERHYKKVARARIREFTKRSSLKLFIHSAIIGCSIATICSVLVALNNSAYKDYNDLTSALESPVYENIAEKIREADNRLNRFFCPEIADSIQSAERWIKTREKQYSELDATITQLERRKKKLAALTPSEIWAIESGIDQSPLGREQLLKRWQDVCLREYNELATQKASILQQIESPLPSMPDFSGDYADDCKALEAYKLRLYEKLRETQAAIKLYQMVSDAPARIHQRIDAVDTIINEIRQLKSNIEKLSDIRNYEAYCRLIQQLEIRDYKPKQYLTNVKQHLPTEETVAYHMAAPHGQYSPELLLAARDILVHKKASFPAAFPAEGNILSIPDDILTAPSLLYKVYTLKLSEKETWYSTIQPVLDQTNFITYRRSSVDPRFTPENNYREFQNDDTYSLGEIDATELLPDLNIERNTFFVQSNIPQLLTNVLNYKEGKHPALAQACIYLCLLRVTDAHPHPLLNGVRFSPTLKAHSESFIALIKRRKIDLKPGCWLSTDAAIERAEQDFAEWFRTNRGHDYTTEMAQNFIKAFYVTPDFCGYIDENRKPRMFEPAEEDEKLWYVSEQGIKSTATAGDFASALPLSPLFKEKRKSR